jgi:uncharacterized membrane protein
MRTVVSLSLSILKHIMLRKLQKYFLLWHFKSKSTPANVKAPVLDIKSLKISTSPSILSKKTFESKSPIEASKRLYRQAQEIQQKKDLLQKNFYKKCSFTPKVTGFTKKWLQIKDKKKIPELKNDVAVVSARTITPLPQYNIERSFTPIL